MGNQYDILATIFQKSVIIRWKSVLWTNHYLSLEAMRVKFLAQGHIWSPLIWFKLTTDQSWVRCAIYWPCPL